MDRLNYWKRTEELNLITQFSRIMSDSNPTRTRDLPACSIVPQPTTLPCVPSNLPPNHYSYGLFCDPVSIRIIFVEREMLRWSAIN
jgi:hypothetical protein